jgi:hypothetical protein
MRGKSNVIKRNVKKNFGCTLYIRCALSAEKYGIWHLEVYFTLTLLMRSTPFNNQNKDKQENTCMNTGNAVFTGI